MCDGSIKNRKNEKEESVNISNEKAPVAEEAPISEEKTRENKGSENLEIKNNKLILVHQTF